MARIPRPLYKRHKTYVAVRTIRMGGDNYIQPGQVVKLRDFHMRSLHRRRRIGEQDHPWTVAMLKAHGFYRPEISGDVEEPPKLEPVKIDKKWYVDGHDVEFKTKREAQEFIDKLGESNE